MILTGTKDTKKRSGWALAEQFSKSKPPKDSSYHTKNKSDYSPLINMIKFHGIKK